MIRVYLMSLGEARMKTGLVKQIRFEIAGLIDEDNCTSIIEQLSIDIWNTNLKISCIYEQWINHPTNKPSKVSGEHCLALLLKQTRKSSPVHDKHNAMQKAVAFCGKKCYKIKTSHDRA